MSTPEDGAAAHVAAFQAVELQRNYLRNPLPADAGVCAVCRGGVDPRFDHCYQCNQHRSASGGVLADAVVPIAYSIKGTQHAHNLIIYKAQPPSPRAQFMLAALGIHLFTNHWHCLARAARGTVTHVVTVPSTRGRPGAHPVEAMLAGRLALPALRPVANVGYPNEDRSFHHDRFLLPVGAAEGARVLLLDDTWTTGGRIQSLAFTLKAAGATAVVAVVLGRHVNPGYGPSGPLIERLRAARPFDLGTCAIH